MGKSDGIGSTPDIGAGESEAGGGPEVPPTWLGRGKVARSSLSTAFTLGHTDNRYLDEQLLYWWSNPLYD